MLSFFLQFFVKKMQIHSSLVQNLQKKFATPFLRTDKERKEKRRTFNGSIFSETRLLSRNSLFKKIIIQTQGVFTHTRVHTHTLLSLSICKLSEHCCCCCCELGVFSSSLSLSFLVRKKKGKRNVRRLRTTQKQ